MKTVAFTAHNVRLDDGTYTFPERERIDQTGDYAAVKNLLPVLFPDGWQGRSIVDLGCLEGGFATEFARLGLDSTGIEVRESNIANAEYIKSKTNLSNLRFIRDDAWNVAKHGPFDLVFCVGLHYHIDDQLRFLREMSAACTKAIFIDTHVAPEFDDQPAVSRFNLSELTAHEGLPGRWYGEHDLDVANSASKLEKLKWASWANTRSFWPTRGALVTAMRMAGFSIVFEDFDQHVHGSVRALSPEGWNYRESRGMFVGIKTPADGAPVALEPADATPGPRYRSSDAELIERCESLKHDLQVIYRSKSWKLTSPLREMARRVRR